VLGIPAQLPYSMEAAYMAILDDQAIALSIPAFCRNYSVCRSKAYELINNGDIEAKKNGAKTLIDRASADRWYANLPSFSPAPRIAKMRATIARSRP